MKSRIVPAVVLAAAVAFGTAGCGFIVPQATTYDYAPSDGIDVDLPNANIRNLLLVAGDDAVNVVFTGVNNTDETVRVGIKFVEDGAQLGQANLNLDSGINVFGTDQQVIVPVSLQPGSMATAFIESDGVEIERQVPVLDDTLAEYSELVP